MNFFKKHPGFIQAVIWITIIGFVAAYIPLLFVSSEEPSYEQVNELYDPLSQPQPLNP